MAKEISKEMARRNPLAVWVGHTIQFCQDRKGLLTSILVILVVSAGGVAGYSWYQARQEQEAQAVLGKAQAALQGQKPNTPGNAEEAKKFFEEAVSRFPGTVAAQESLVRLGNMQYEGGKYDDAIGTYGKYLSTYPSGQFRLLAGIGKGYAEEGKGDLPAAVSTLSDLVRTAKDDPMAGEAYSDLARLYEVSKKPEDALRVYGEIVERFPQTRWAQHALQRMGALKAK
jgi:outer membrane protein assembly factor BamD (BamD/ComL family)